MFRSLMDRLRSLRSRRRLDVLDVIADAEPAGAGREGAVRSA